MRKWTEEAMSSAVAAVKAGKAVRAASIEYGVPKSSLGDRVSGRVTEGARLGKASFLSKQEETELIETAQKRAERGTGFSKTNFLRFAGVLAQRNGKGFKQGKPSNMWYRRLKGRHTSFSLRTPEATGTVRHDAMSRVRLANYFSELKNVIEMHNFASFPERIWNMDETGLNVAHKPRQVIAKKGAKSIHGKTSGARETVTVIACGNAAGSYIPPHFIMPGKSRKENTWL